MTREEIAAYKVDKSGWGAGQWQNEPDRVDFVHAGLPCLALRHPRNGNWCGYAAVPKGHRLYGVEFSELDGITAHFGLSYSDHCAEGICHCPETGEPDDVWWLGFDCDATFDLAPGREARDRARGWAPIPPEGSYRTLPYVRHEIERLAEQLAAIT